MKITAFALILALFLVSLAAPQLNTAQNRRPSAHGNFQFSTEDGLAKHIHFKAQTEKDGSTKGEMTFNDPSEIPEQDVDVTGLGGSLSGIFMKAEFDCLIVNGNTAVMAGVITVATAGDAIGRRVLLVVEDNGEGNSPSAPDRLTWGIYKSVAKDWSPKDAEREDDEGASLTWMATDAEREDEIGIPSRVSETVDCKSFSLSSYSFIDITHGDGNIQVLP